MKHLAESSPRSITVHLGGNCGSPRLHDRQEAMCRIHGLRKHEASFGRCDLAGPGSRPVVVDMASGCTPPDIRTHLLTVANQSPGLPHPRRKGLFPPAEGTLLPTSTRPYDSHALDVPQERDNARMAAPQNSTHRRSVCGWPGFQVRESTSHARTAASTTPAAKTMSSCSQKRRTTQPRSSSR
jgi:hypothetical protein